jgi:hypothetical protein
MALLATRADSTFPSAADASEGHARLRLIGCRVEHDRGAVTRAMVECEGAFGRRTVGLQEGTTCPGGDLRLTAIATLDAVLQATDGKLQIDLVGVKAMRAFDSTVVVVAAAARQNNQHTRVVGAAMADADLLTATARATLQAVNRLVSPHLTHEPLAE